MKLGQARHIKLGQQSKTLAGQGARLVAISNQWSAQSNWTNLNLERKREC